ncbi:hypothetical protein ACFZAD_24685 [Streptomyces iakyrus]|uniref:hypothetical protein n=1 Tax=Streptomyces iakyrus TaxID=68219 RepID=UPI0036F0C5E9
MNTTNAMSQSAALGGIYIMIFMLIVVGVAMFVLTTVAPRVNARRRDQEIETAMRLGVRDAEAQARAARRIVNEYRDGH